MYVINAIVSSSVSAPWNIDLTPFYLGCPPKIQKLSAPTPLPPFWATPLKILET